MNRLLVGMVCVLASACTAQPDALVIDQFDGGTTESPFPVDFGDPMFGGPQPVFGPTVTQPTPPPPLSGGTLLMLKDGHTAVAADPDRDHVYVVDVSTKAKIADLALQPRDEPGRLLEDAAGRIHVALRTGGALVTIDPATWTVSGRRAVCAAPRGVAYEAAGDLVHVACAGGELVSFPAAGGSATRTLQLERDLRDVIVDGAQLLVSRFKTAELLVVSPTGTISQRLVPPNFRVPEVRANAEFSSSTAWRTLAAPGGGVIMVHQRGTLEAVTPKPGGYGSPGSCGGIVHAAVSVLKPGATPAPTPAINGVVLPIDFALSPDGTQVAILSAGNAHTPNLPTLVMAPSSWVTGPPFCYAESSQPVISGEPTAVAFDASGRVLVQTREPATLQIVQVDGFPPAQQGMFTHVATISLSTDSRADTGHAVFHSNAGGDIACASCHPEGGEDGRVWSFDGIGPRRTQSLRGGILGTEPFHWNGDEANLSQLVDDVFVGRMSGPKLLGDQLSALSHYVDTLPELPQSPPPDTAAVDRGRALFQDAVGVGCVSCHGGPKLTNHATVSVGTGASFQVPALHGVGWRAPFLHDGCAKTLTDRFGPCGGGDQHGQTSQLSAAQIADLVAYLESI